MFNTCKVVVKSVCNNTKVNGFVKHGFVINLTGFVITVELIHLEKREDAYQEFFREYNL